MKRSTSVFAMLIPLLAFSQEAYDFRKTKWGMTAEEVKRAEAGKPLEESGKIIIYSGSLSNLLANVGYQFVGNQLATAGYNFTQKHAKKNTYVDDYAALRKGLIAKYGKPIQDQTGWRNETYRKDPSKYGTAVSLGHLVYRAEWSTARSRIVLKLSGQNSQCRLNLVYYSKELYQAWKDRNKNKQQDDPER